ncbi:MAG: hypothetical protein SGILL_008752, partial [Bacillariaceae sp.]
GRESGHIQGGAGFESETMHKFHIIRSQYGAIGDELQGRMPLAYAHIVQVLVDLILWMFPVMAFSISMSPFLVLIGTGLLTISYQGLFDLAKQFLDPYDNENYGRGEDPLCVDTLIAETNAGSVRWLYGFEEMPYSAQRVADGELYDYLLPVRGWSVEELAQMEEERIEREKQLEEQRKREEEEVAERLRKEAEEMAEMKEEGEEADVTDSEVQTQSALEELSLESVDAIETPVNVTKSVEKSRRRSKNRQEPVKGNKTEAVETDGVAVNGGIVANKTELNEQAVNATAINATAENESGRKLHKVTTLATGSPVTFNPVETAKKVVELPVPSGTQAANYLSTLRQEEPELSDKERNSFVPDLVEYKQFEDLPWYDEQEFRLSQQLADEEWVEDGDDVETKTMTWDEYQERLQEIKENAENEYRETSEILSASPGADGDEKLYTVKERKKKAPPTYDQTRLDGISQLWGLPPEDPSDIGEYEPPEKIEDMNFDSISQLWGGASLSSDIDDGSSKSKKKDEPDDVVGMDTFAGISELWGNSLDDFQDDSDQALTNGSRHDNATSSESQEAQDENDGSVDDERRGSFSDLPWHNERGQDGKEFRLSEMLADEEWETEEEPEESTAMTLEDYNKQVEEILTQAEEELRETEAILMSKPGTDPLGWDYDDEDLAPMSENGEEDVEGEEDVADAASDSEDLAVLEMDSEDDEEAKVNGDSIPEELDMKDATVSANGETATEVNGDSDEESEDAPADEILDCSDCSDDNDSVEGDAGGHSQSDGIEEEPAPVEDAAGSEEVKNDEATGADEVTDRDDAEAQDVVEDDEGAKGSDTIQPIFLEGESDDESKDNDTAADADADKE